MPVHLSPELTDLRHKMKEFIDGEVIPAEPALLGKDPLVAADMLEELKAEAKRRDLWALGHPAEIGGGGPPVIGFVFFHENIRRREDGPKGVRSGSLQGSIHLPLYPRDGERGGLGQTL